MVYRLEAGDNPSLTKVCEWNHNYLVMSLATHGSRLIVGDAISSVSILSFQGETLTTVARDYGPLWPVAVEAWGEEGVVGANVSNNDECGSPLTVLHHRATAISLLSAFNVQNKGRFCIEMGTIISTTLSTKLCWVSVAPSSYFPGLSLIYVS